MPVASPTPSLTCTFSWDFPTGKREEQEAIPGSPIEGACPWEVDVLVCSLCDLSFLSQEAPTGVTCGGPAQYDM